MPLAVIVQALHQAQAAAATDSLEELRAAVRRRLDLKPRLFGLFWCQAPCFVFPK